MQKAEVNTIDAIPVRRKKESQIVMIFKRILRDRGATIGLIGILFFVFVAIFAEQLAPYDPYTLDITAMLTGPSRAHWMGTDELGRDVMSRLIYGTRYSLALGVLGSLMSFACACVLGCIAGYFGKWIESLIMRICDVMMSIPGTLLTIIISAVLGSGFFVTLIALSFGGIFNQVRMLRAQILRERGQEYLEAAEAYNCKKTKIMFIHLLPNVVSPLLVNLTMGISGTINAAATLSFLGLGIQPPTPEWGAMLSGGRDYLRNCPTLILFPGLVIMIFCWCVNLFGDGLRDAMDPKLKN
ncbi:MAG: ABC transporter permease [Lachnospiraceae bacterium]|nr:ABC transporter permease [Lachnospiraceae bacterium]